MHPPPAPSIGLNEIDKLAAPVAEARDSPEWLHRWAQDVLASIDRGTHLAVMSGPYLGLLLDGRKTIESRFSRHRVAPFGQVTAGDVIFFKKTAGPVSAVGLAGEVRHIELDKTPLEEVATRYGEGIAPADDGFWADRSRARYATLITMASITTMEPFSIRKRDRRGWVVIAGSATPTAQGILF
ncbi:ASCH domain-containing protein [Actinomadura sp. 3N508]|uniref:ASCH domain-containing protein n=1 Tax=Actinomadura sp. 3N508 TaxID=3375153 RepID=UPI00378BAB94